jgi:hypothetical protein
MRFFFPIVSLLLGAAAALPLSAKPLIGGLKTIAVDADGTVHETVAKAKLGMGGYLNGAKKVVVPLIAVAFESSAKAKSSRNIGDIKRTLSLETQLVVDEKVRLAIANQLQAIVEKDLAAAGFEVLPKETFDQEPRWMGIAKDGKVGEEIGDNFMSGFGGNGIKSRWYAASNRPLFGTAVTGALAETSSLIRMAREKKISILTYRFKIQYTSIDSDNNLLFNSMSGKEVLHMLSADMAVFTPEHTQGGFIELKADLTAGADYVEKSEGGKGRYVITANPERYQAGSLMLIGAVSKQFADVLRKAQ